MDGIATDAGTNRISTVLFRLRDAPKRRYGATAAGRILFRAVFPPPGGGLISSCPCRDEMKADAERKARPHIRVFPGNWYAKFLSPFFGFMNAPNRSSALHGRRYGTNGIIRVFNGNSTTDKN
jgi:hypothetical protein